MPHDPPINQRNHHRVGRVHRQGPGPNLLSALFSVDSSDITPTPTSIVDSPVAITVSVTSTNTPLSSTIPTVAQPSTTSIPSLTSSSSSLTTLITSTTPSTSSVIPATSTTTQPPPSSVPSTLTFFRTVSSQPAVSVTSSAHPSSTNSAVGGTSGGIIAGGIFAAILGSAGILFAVVYFLRKSRRREDEALAEEIWTRPDARRQSVMLPDEPGPVRPYNSRGAGSPRPPTMIERHLNSAPSMISRQPTMPNMYSNSNNGYGNGYNATEYGQSSFYPGDIVTPTSANPFISPYSQDVMASPVSSNVPDYHVPPQPASPAVPPLALTRRSSNNTGQAAVVRQNSIPGGPHSPMVTSRNNTNSHYVELSRSSVTPSQGMQYADIAEQLHAPMSSVLAAVPEGPHGDAPGDGTLNPHIDLPPQAEDAPKESPFADSVVDASRDLDIEVPLPTPIMFQQPRISSTPPTLPEIRVPERSFSPVASLELPVPLSARESPSPFSVEFSDVRSPPPAGLKFTSSPLATSTPTQAEPTTIPREPKAEAENPKRPDTLYTLYDEEDAYGGF